MEAAVDKILEALNSSTGEKVCVFDDEEIQPTPQSKETGMVAGAHDEFRISTAVMKKSITIVHMVVNLGFQFQDAITNVKFPKTNYAVLCMIMCRVLCHFLCTCNLQKINIDYTRLTRFVHTIFSEISRKAVSIVADEFIEVCCRKELGVNRYTIPTKFVPEKAILCRDCGNVHVQKASIIKVLQDECEIKLINLISQESDKLARCIREREFDGESKRREDDDEIEHLSQLLPNLTKLSQEVGKFKSLDDVIVPPCMMSLHERIKTGKGVADHLSRKPRWAITNFYVCVGVSASEVISKVSDHCKNTRNPRESSDKMKERVKALEKDVKDNTKRRFETCANCKHCFFEGSPSERIVQCSDMMSTELLRRVGDKGFPLVLPTLSQNTSPVDQAIFFSVKAALKSSEQHSS